jgi:hypothetical protein
VAPVAVGRWRVHAASNSGTPRAISSTWYLRWWVGPYPRLPRNILHLTSHMYHIIRVASFFDEMSMPMRQSRRLGRVHPTWGGIRPAQTQHAHEPPNPCVHALRTSCVCVAHFSVAVLWRIISLWPFCGVLRACKCACSGMLPTIARAASQRPSIARFVTGDFTRPRRPCYPCTSR